VEADGTVSAAFTKLGYGAGAIHAVDFYTEDDKIEYQFIDGKWVRIV